jgi:DUF4097 and DUF4098 domain-containing protein YvlB
MTKSLITLVLTATVSAATLTAATQHDYKIEDREPIRHTFNKDAALEVDNVNGSITVIGDSGATIRVEGEKLIRAADQTELQRAKREVVLDANEKDGAAQLYVNGPFRDNDHSSQNHGFHESRDRQYEVVYNFVIRVPSATDLKLHTINGDLKADNTTGKFNIKGINGSITMTNVAGSGTADTLNGPTLIKFRENPKQDSYFKSFNGRVDVTLQPGLSANLRVKTFNGQAYTDFDVTALANTPGTGELRNGKFVYKSNQFQTMKVGNGGPELKFESFNGSIHIQKGNK